MPTRPHTPLPDIPEEFYNAVTRSHPDYTMQSNPGGFQFVNDSGDPLNRRQLHTVMKNYAGNAGAVSSPRVRALPYSDRLDLGERVVDRMSGGRRVPRDPEGFLSELQNNLDYEDALIDDVAELQREWSNEMADYDYEPFNPDDDFGDRPYEDFFDEPVERSPEMEERLRGMAEERQAALGENERINRLRTVEEPVGGMPKRVRGFADASRERGAGGNYRYDPETQSLFQQNHNQPSGYLEVDTSKAAERASLSGTPRTGLDQGTQSSHRGARNSRPLGRARQNFDKFVSMARDLNPAAEYRRYKRQPKAEYDKWLRQGGPAEYKLHKTPDGVAGIQKFAGNQGIELDGRYVEAPFTSINIANQPNLPAVEETLSIPRHRMWSENKRDKLAKEAALFGDRTRKMIKSPEGSDWIKKQTSSIIDQMPQDGFFHGQGATPDLKRAYNYILRKQYGDRQFTGTHGGAYVAGKDIASRPSWPDVRAKLSNLLPSAGVAALQLPEVLNMYKNTKQQGGNPLDFIGGMNSLAPTTSQFGLGELVDRRNNMQIEDVTTGTKRPAWTEWM